MSQGGLFDDEPIELLPVDPSASFHGTAFAEAEARSLFERLQEEIPWEQRQVRMFGKWIDQPRLVAWFGDSDAPYTYSGLTLKPHPWTPTVEECRRRCEALAGVSFNSGLANLYRTGQDTVGWHSDDEPELGDEPVIASVSFGATRRFDLRHKSGEPTIKADLVPGSVLIMSGRCQSHWKHQVARTKRVDGPRINLTFRRLG